MANKHAVVRTDRLFGTDNRAGLISIKYFNNDEAAEIDNGHVLKVGPLLEGEREVFEGTDAEAVDPLENVVLVASPEVMYDVRLRDLDDFYNEAGRIARAYRLHDGDIFSVTPDALESSADPAVGNIVTLADGNKLAVGGKGTIVGRVIAIDIVGRFTYVVILVDPNDTSN